MADKKAKKTTKQIGDWGEDRAAAWLEERGYQILDRNIFTPYGEIDILARLENRLIFVEVKTRRSTRFGRPEEAVTERKIQHLVESAQHFLQEQPDLVEDWQIDVISIQADRKTGRTEFTHFENAV
jgi:putative endonuclease